MNPELKKEWVSALRSGKFAQVQGKLKNRVNGGYGYCCLGVLCEISPDIDMNYHIGHGRPKILNRDIVKDILEEAYYDDDHEFLIEDEEFDHALRRYFFGQYGYDHHDILVKMNDDGESFEDIADYIEKNL